MGFELESDPLDQLVGAGGQHHATVTLVEVAIHEAAGSGAHGGGNLGGHLVEEAQQAGLFDAGCQGE